MVRYVHPGEELAVQIKQGIRAADVANTASGTEKARTRDSTIISLLDEFAVTLSPTVEPVGGWSPVAPPWVAGEYVWKRTTTTYGDGATAVGPALLATGNDGAPGADGTDGADGASVSSSTMFYWLGATQPAAPTVLTPPSPWSATEPSYTPGTSSNLYVVVRTVLSSGAFSYSAVSLSASFAAAKSAFEKYTFSAAAPVAGDGAGKPVGALWVRKSGAGEIIGYWEWSGSAWQARPLSQEIIPLIVAGMISAGAIDGMTITGATVRTAASGARVQMDAGGIKAFDAENNTIATIASGAGGAVPGFSVAIPTAGSVLIGNTGSGGPSVAAYGLGAVIRKAEALVTDNYSGFTTQHRGGVLRADIYDQGVGAGGVAQIISNRQVNIASDQDIRITPGTGKKIVLFGPVEFQGDTDWKMATTSGSPSDTARLATGWTNVDNEIWDGLKVCRRRGMVQISGPIVKSSFSTAIETVATLPVGYRPEVPMAFFASYGATGSYVFIKSDGTINTAINLPAGAQLTISAAFPTA